MPNLTFQTDHSIGTIFGLSQKEIDQIVQDNQEDQEDDDFVIGGDDAMYPVEIEEQWKLKDADILKRDEEKHSTRLETGNDEEGMYPLTVTE